MVKAHNKPKLIPVKVPWAIAPSTPFLKLVVLENGPVIVEFVAQFFLEQLKRRTQDLNSRKTVQVVSERPGLDKSDKSGPEQLVTVIFEEGGWARATPATSVEAIDEAAYDWSEAPPGYQPGDDIDDYLRRFSEQWIDTGLCPHPGMYTVQNSDWLRDVTRARELNYEHVLFVGEDLSIEVLGKSWRWQSEGRVDW